MAHLFHPQAAKNYVAIPFFLTAGIFFVIFGFLLVWSEGQILGHHFQPRTLAMVHTLALGWGTMLMFGAAYQLVPVIFECPLYGYRLALLSYVLLALGSSLLIYSFWYFKIGWIMCLGGALITLSSYVYFYILWMTTKKVDKLFEFHLYFTLSAFWLCCTTTVGLLLALHLMYGFLPKNHLDMLKLHAHVGLVGWFMQLILGAGAKMIPMFMLGRSTKGKLLYLSIILINVGLFLFLIDGYSHPVGIRSLAYAGVILLGLVCWIVFILDCFTHRVRKVLDVPMKHTVVSLICLGLAFGTLPLVVQQESGNWVGLYAIWIFLGWVTGLILGMTFKTFPFIIWNIRYKELNGTVHVPMPKDLYSERLLRLQYYLYIVALAAIAAGAIFKLNWLLYAASWLWLALACCYLTNVSLLLIHREKKWK